MASVVNVELRDIHGLDPVSWWPLAPEAWLAIALTTIITFLIISWIYRLFRYPPGSWRSEARRGLRQLQCKLSNQTSKQSASDLSQLLRRIAIARYGRPGQASLEGDNWLKWLEETDPNHFDWQERGRLLTTLPYAPDDTESDTAAVKKLIKAALNLVGSSRGGAAKSHKESPHV